MTDELKLQYGFQLINNPKGLTALKLFEAIPLYPEEVTYMELAKKFHTSATKICMAIYRLPSNAPVAEINANTLTRIK